MTRVKLNILIFCYLNSSFVSSLPPGMLQSFHFDVISFKIEFSMIKIYKRMSLSSTNVKISSVLYIYSREKDAGYIITSNLNSRILNEKVSSTFKHRISRNVFPKGEVSFGHIVQQEDKVLRRGHILVQLKSEASISFK